MFAIFSVPGIGMRTTNERLSGDKETKREILIWATWLRNQLPLWSTVLGAAVSPLSPGFGKDCLTFRHPCCQVSLICMRVSKSVGGQKSQGFCPYGSFHPSTLLSRVFLVSPFMYALLRAEFPTYGRTLRIEGDCADMVLLRVALNFFLRVQKDFRKHSLRTNGNEQFLFVEGQTIINFFDVVWMDIGEKEFTFEAKIGVGREEKRGMKNRQPDTHVTYVHWHIICIHIIYIYIYYSSYNIYIYIYYSSISCIALSLDAWGKVLIGLFEDFGLLEAVGYVGFGPAKCEKLTEVMKGDECGQPNIVLVSRTLRRPYWPAQVYSSSACWVAILSFKSRSSVLETTLRADFHRRLCSMCLTRSQFAWTSKLEIPLKTLDSQLKCQDASNFTKTRYVRKYYKWWHGKLAKCARLGLPPTFSFDFLPLAAIMLRRHRVGWVVLSSWIALHLHPAWTSPRRQRRQMTQALHRIIYLQRLAQTATD